MLLTKLTMATAVVLVLATMACGGGLVAPGKQVDARTAEKLMRLPHAANALVYSLDGRTLATAGQDHTIRLWQVSTGKEIRRLEGHKGEVLSLAISPDGKTLASGSNDCNVRLWDLATGKERRRLPGYRSRVIGVAFSPDSKRLAAAGGGEGMCT